MHYDGWLRLPAEICQRLDLTTRSTLRVWVEGSTVVLEPDPIVGAMSPDDAEAGEATPAASERVAAVGDRAETDPELKEATSEAVAPPAAQTDEPAPPTRKRAVRKPPAALAVGSAARPRGRRKAGVSAGDEPPS